MHVYHTHTVIFIIYTHIILYYITLYTYMYIHTHTPIYVYTHTVAYWISRDTPNSICVDSQQEH